VLVLVQVGGGFASVVPVRAVKVIKPVIMLPINVFFNLSCCNFLLTFKEIQVKCVRF
jgi:hypothetical protein